MRQGQQNRRGRGRNNNNNNNNGSNNNRKSQNPLTRSFESTGPDVKVRGTPAHVAEKYITLARDALSSGDRVLAENYLQHAEHYNRIILTYREQQMSQGGEFQPGLPRAQTFSAQDPDGEEFGDEDGDELAQGGQPQAASGDGQPQPAIVPQRQFDNQQRFDNRPRHDNRNNPNHQRQDRDGNRYDRGERHDNRGDNRFNRNDNRGDNRGDRGDRGDRGERTFDRQHDRGGDRHDRAAGGAGGEPRDFRDDRGQPPFVGESHSGEGHGNGARRRERFQNQNGNGERAPQGFSAQPGLTPQPSVPLAAPTPAPALEAEQQPAFLRRPVRRPRRDDTEAAVPPAPRDTSGGDAE